MFPILDCNVGNHRIWCIKIILIIIFMALSTLSTEVFKYKFHSSNDESINECLRKAMKMITEETCLSFETETIATSTEAILFMQSPFCSWQKSNRTMHLNENCLSDLSSSTTKSSSSSDLSSSLPEDACLVILSRTLSSVPLPPIRSHVVRLINTMYNCTDRCNIECENGGNVRSIDCSCICGYGFEGEHCEKLSRRKLFTDPHCGVYEQQQGVISLSTYPEARIGATFCQWLIRSKPGKTIEFYIKDLDLDGDEVPPHQPCNDIFYIWGTKSIVNPIPCSVRDNIVGVRYESDFDWLLIELRTNPWSERPHRGPRIRYRLIDAPYQRSFRTFTAEVTSSSDSNAVSAMIILFLIMMLS